MSENIRQRYVTDDDGHGYLIPAEKREEFDRWLGHQQKLWGGPLSDEEFKKLDAEYTGEDFEDYRAKMDISNYTFENVQEDK